MALVTLSEVKTYLGVTVTDYDTFLQSEIDLFSAAINNYCGRKFEETTYVETFYYSDYTENRDRKILQLYSFPLSSIASVKEIETTDAVDNETTLAVTEYRAGNTARIRKFSEGQQLFWFSNLQLNSRIEIEYTAGYATTPLEVQNVIYALIEERFNKHKSGVNLDFGNNVQRVSIPGTISIDYDYTLQANERSQTYGMFLGNYVNVLDFWRSERAVVSSIKEVYVSP